jgi:hypothetical protein
MTSIGMPKRSTARLNMTAVMIKNSRGVIACAPLVAESNKLLSSVSEVSTAPAAIPYGSEPIVIPILFGEIYVGCGVFTYGVVTERIRGMKR